MKKIVIHLISTSIFSGAENVACQIINSFKNDQNYEILYVSQILQNKTSLNERKINYYPLKKFNYKYIKKAIKELQPTIIHAHDIKSSIIASCFAPKIKVISHIHSNHENMRKINFKTIIFNICSRKISRIIWVSKSALENYIFKRKIENKSTILYNAINSQEIINKAEMDKNKYKKYDLIFLGRLSFPKNPERLLKIISEVAFQKPKLKVAIVGDGELKKEIEKSAQNKNLTSIIDFYGFLNNPYKILSSSKIMLMTSRYEGTPMCILEALSFGIPVISTKIDGIKDIIINNKNGFLSNDDLELVTKIIYLLNNKDELNKMQKNAKESSMKINDLQKYQKELIKIYEK